MELKHMKTTEQKLLETITEVNHLAVLSDGLKKALPSETSPEIVRSVDVLDACIGRIQEKCGELQHLLAQADDDGPLTMTPAGWIAGN